MSKDRSWRMKCCTGDLAYQVTLGGKRVTPRAIPTYRDALVPPREPARRKRDGLCARCSPQ